MTEKQFTELAIKKFEHLSYSPFDANIKYWLETHTINGSFLIAIRELYKDLKKLNAKERN